MTVSEREQAATLSAGADAARATGRGEMRPMVRSVSGVAAAKLLVVVTGLLRTVAIAAAFGTGRVTDAFFIAYFLPETIHMRLMGPLVGAFVPVMVGSITAGDRETARRLVWTLFHWVLLIAGGASVLGCLLATPLVGLVAPGFAPATRTLASGIVWLLLPMALFTTTGALVEGTLGAHRRFAASAVAPVLFNVVVIASVLALGRGGGGVGRGLGIHGLALGFLAAAVVQLAVQVPSFRRLGLAHGPYLSLRHPAVRQVLWLMLPIFLDNTVGLAIRFVENNLASRLAPGSLSSLGFALRLYGVPVGIFAMGLVTVILPYLSAHHAGEDRAGFRRTTSFGMRALILVCLPVAVLFLLAGRDIVAVFYRHGLFGESSVEQTSRVFRMLALGLVAQGLALFFCKVLYALRNTMAILKVSCAVAVFNIAFDLLAVPRLGVEAIALGASLTWILDAGILVLVVRRYRGVLDGPGLLSFAWRTLAAAAAMAAAVAGSAAALRGEGALARCLLQGAAGSATFLLACGLLRVREMRDVWRLVAAKLFRARDPL